MIPAKESIFTQTNNYTFNNNIIGRPLYAIQRQYLVFLGHNIVHAQSMKKTAADVSA